MNVLFIVIMLTLTPSGAVIKQTTEVPVTSLKACIELQVKTTFQELPENVSVASAICKITKQVLPHQSI